MLNFIYENSGLSGNDLNTVFIEEYELDISDKYTSFIKSIYLKG